MSDDEVGYGKPPKHTQFKPGQSGNPKGKPKGCKNRRTLMDEELNKIVKIKEGSKVKSVTKKEAMLMKLMQDALNGKPHAVKLVLKEVDFLEMYPPITHQEITWGEEQKLLMAELTGYQKEEDEKQKKAEETEKELAELKKLLNELKKTNDIG